MYKYILFIFKYIIKNHLSYLKSNKMNLFFKIK